MAIGPLLWGTDDTVLNQLARTGTWPHVVMSGSGTVASNQGFNKPTGGVTMSSIPMPTPTGAPVMAGGSVNLGGGMSAAMQQIAGMMAPVAAQTAATATPDKPKTFDELHPNGTPSGKNYVDPRLSSPSWQGGSGIYDDSSGGANVAGQLAARTKPPAGGGSGGTPKPPPTGGGSGGHKPPWRWW